MTLALNVVTSYATRRSHEAMLRLAQDLSAAQLKQQPSTTSPSIAFHVWHLARWADLLQSRIPGMTVGLGTKLGKGRQIWDAEGLAQEWGFAQFDLGGEATGMGMDEDVSAALPLPDRERLLGYAQRAFEAANRAVEAADEDALRESCTDLYGRETSVGAAIVGHLAHVNRHLGMIEALRGVHGLKGTATI
jgi:hypothetical protein